jgi:hypothetical protein
MPLIYQADIMSSLSYLLGERTVPSTGTEGRKDFIQKTLEELYRNNEWPFAQALATISVVSGLASLPTDFSDNHEVSVKYYNGATAVDMLVADDEQQDNINTGDNKFWLTTYTGDGAYLLNTKEVISNVIVRYQKLPPTLAASVGTPYPSAETIALGAKRYYRMSQNPEADISQDEALFQKRAQEDFRALQMVLPFRGRKSAQSVSGYSTGSF